MRKMYYHRVVPYFLGCICIAAVWWNSSILAIPLTNSLNSPSNDATPENENSSLFSTSDEVTDNAFHNGTTAPREELEQDEMEISDSEIMSTQAPPSLSFHDVTGESTPSQENVYAILNYERVASNFSEENVKELEEDGPQTEIIEVTENLNETQCNGCCNSSEHATLTSKMELSFFQFTVTEALETDTSEDSSPFITDWRLSNSSVDLESSRNLDESDDSTTSMTSSESSTENLKRFDTMDTATIKAYSSTQSSRPGSFPKTSPTLIYKLMTISTPITESILSESSPKSTSSLTQETRETIASTNVTELNPATDPYSHNKDVEELTTDVLETHKPTMENVLSTQITSHTFSPVEDVPTKPSKEPETSPTDSSPKDEVSSPSHTTSIQSKTTPILGPNGGATEITKDISHTFSPVEDVPTEPSKEPAPSPTKSTSKDEVSSPPHTTSIQSKTTPVHWPNAEVTNSPSTPSATPPLVRPVPTTAMNKLPVDSLSKPKTADRKFTIAIILSVVLVILLVVGIALSSAAHEQAYRLNGRFAYHTLPMTNEFTTTARGIVPSHV